MPIPYGTWNALPATKSVRCAWMWNAIFSDGWQVTPSTVSPGRTAFTPAKTGAFGTGTPSGPSGPLGGGG